MEFIGGFDFENPLGLTWSGKGRILLANEDSIQKISISSSFEFDHGNDELGMLFELSPSWGQANTKEQNDIWSSDIIESNGDLVQYSDGTQIDFEIGYGFGINDKSGILTPCSRYAFDHKNSDELLMGTEVKFGSNLEFDVNGVLKIGGEDTNINKVEFSGNFIW